MNIKLEKLVKLGKYKTKLLNPKSQKVQLMDAETDTFYDASGYYYPRNTFNFSYKGVIKSNNPWGYVEVLSMVQDDFLEGRGALGPWASPLYVNWRKEKDPNDFGYYINRRGRLFKRIKNTCNIKPSSYRSMQKYCREDKTYREKVLRKLKQLKI